MQALKVAGMESKFLNHPTTADPTPINESAPTELTQKMPARIENLIIHVDADIVALNKKNQCVGVWLANTRSCK